MSDFFYTEAMKVIGSVTIGSWLGYYLRRAQSKAESRAQLRKAEVERWRKEAQSYWFPLLEAADDLQHRLVEQKERYKEQKSKPLRDWYPGDFCELYVLDRDQVDTLNENLELADPNSARKDEQAVERTRIRMAYQLTYAVSSIYKMARYLGTAEYALRALKEFNVMLPDEARSKIMCCILDVRASLEGKREATGIFSEQQEAIGEIVWDPAGQIITHYEFRKRMFEPGWEQFIGLFRFYVHFHQKLESEVNDTIEALQSLRELQSLLNEMDRLAGKDYDTIWDRRIK